jgi:hypothetical protein
MTASGFGQSLSGDSTCAELVEGGVAVGGWGLGAWDWRLGARGWACPELVEGGLATRGSGLDTSVTRLEGVDEPEEADVDVSAVNDEVFADELLADASLDGLPDRPALFSDRGQPVATISVVKKTAAATIASFSIHHVPVLEFRLPPAANKLKLELQRARPPAPATLAPDPSMSTVFDHDILNQDLQLLRVRQSRVE